MSEKKLTYYEKLKDPRWQKKRLEVMQLKEFTCELCGDFQSTLNVHHKEYFKNHEPWDYEANQLAVFCESCHENNHNSNDLLKYISSILEFDGPRDRDSLSFMLAGYIGLDYNFALSKSNYEDCAFAKAFYDKGVKVCNMDLEMRSYIKMYENKNG